MFKEETLIIGNGEVGKALYDVLSKTYSPVYQRDVLEIFLPTEIKFLHICYPYTRDFIKNTQKYIKQYKPLFTIIHSTVPVGTTRKVGASVWHSPIRGLHPDLAKGIMTFDKYIGGDHSDAVLSYFKNAGIPTIWCRNPETTEIGKILDTTYYGWNIVFCKEAEKICKKYGADLSIAYYAMNESYNEGYKKLGMPHVVRPVLFSKPGKIGGHCVINNCKLLKEKLTKIILKFNKKY